MSAHLMTLEEDNTPYLSDQLIGKPLWHVVVHNWSLKLKSSAIGVEDRYVRTVDVFVDPVNGHILKVRTRWPEGELPIAPEPSATSATEQMLRSGEEKYHEFPSTPAPISFMEAVDVIHKGGGNPAVAKQLIGQWVVWSRMGQSPRPMWVITLRGIPPTEAAYPGVPVHLRDHLRYVVDPVAKRWVTASTIPQPEQRALPREERRLHPVKTRDKSR